MNLVRSLLFVLVCISCVWAGSQEQKLARWLQQYPQADANHDGHLTVEEARAYRATLQSLAVRDRAPAARGAPRQFQVDPGWDADRFPAHAVCYRTPQEIRTIYAKTRSRPAEPCASSAPATASWVPATGRFPSSAAPPDSSSPC
jgi:hypothetical protein